MDKKFVDGLFDALTFRLKGLSSVGGYSSVLAEIMKTLSMLKNHVLTSDFVDEQSEIVFFKQIKPRFYSLFIFEVEKYNLINCVPVGDDDMLRDYYYKELSFITRYFDQHAFYYQYFKTGQVDMDTTYFLRRTLDPINPHGTVGCPDDSAENFSTNLDYIFAKFIALERLQKTILQRVKSLNPRFSYYASQELHSKKQLKWTGDKIHLVELVYAIYLTGSLNDGKADLATIVSWMENSLQIRIGSVYRKFIDLSRRKKASITLYLDAAREAIANHALNNL